MSLKEVTSAQASLQITPTEKPPVTIQSLPPEIALKIFGDLKASDALRACRVCKDWNGTLKDHLLWKFFYYRDFKPRGELSGITDFAGAYKEAYLKLQVIRSNLAEGKYAWYSLEGQAGVPRGFRYTDGKIVSSFLENSKNVYKLWDANTGHCLFQRDVEWDLSDDAGCLFICADDKLFLTNSDATGIDVIDINTGECIRTLEGHTAPVVYLEYADEKLFSSSFDSTIKSWDKDTGACLYTLVGDTDNEGKPAKLHTCMYADGMVFSCYFTDGEYFTLKIWDKDTGDCFRTFKEWLDEEGCYHLTCFGGIFFTDDNGKTINGWNIQTGECALTIPLDGSDGPVCKRIDHVDGKLIVVFKDAIKIFRTDTGDCLCSLEWYYCDEADGALYANKKNLISASIEDYTIKIWDINTGDCLHTIDFGLSFSGAAYRDGKIILFDEMTNSVDIFDFGRSSLKGPSTL